MTKPSTCILCLGSNYERDFHMADARNALSKCFHNIRFGEEMITQAIGDGMLSPFSNQLAKFDTHHTFEEIHRILKDIERQSGRTPNDKHLGIVKLDIDILVFNNQTIKPADLQRDYVQKGLKAFE